VINHNQLKLAFDMAARYGKDHNVHVGVTWLHEAGKDSYKLTLPDEYHFDNLDDLVHKLMEFIRNPNKAKDESENEKIISVLQSQVNDLRWRMNDVCNVLSLPTKGI
jgi:hypothetical protein